MLDAIALPRAARGYPADAAEIRVLQDGQPLLIRPMAARDRELLQEFVRGLSPQSRYQRFQQGLRELPPDLLTSLLNVDYRRSMAFAAVAFSHGSARMIGEARYAPALDRPGIAEFALAVADAWQHQGLGGSLLEKLLAHAERNGITRMRGDVLHDNASMLRLTQRHGFVPRPHPDGAWLVRVEQTLGSFAIAA